jgi:hypothetical protein
MGARPGRRDLKHGGGLTGALAQVRCCPSFHRALVGVAGRWVAMWWMSGWRGVMSGWRGWWRSEGLTDWKKQMRTFPPACLLTTHPHPPSPSHPLLSPHPEHRISRPQLHQPSPAPTQPPIPPHLAHSSHPPISFPPLPPRRIPPHRQPPDVRFTPLRQPACSRSLPLTLTACAPSPRSSGAKPALCEDMRKAGWLAAD